jgi:hypothetical protein
MAEIHKFSRGIPRLINILCDFLLLSAFTEQTRNISLSLVEEIVKDLNLNQYWAEIDSQQQQSSVAFKNKIYESIHKEFVQPLEVQNLILQIKKLERSYATLSNIAELVFAMDKKITQLENLNKIFPKLIEKVTKL